MHPCTKKSNHLQYSPDCDICMAMTMKNSPGKWTVLFITLVFLAPGCQDKPVLTKRPNIILITIDTLRADHLSCYGYHRKTSPVIDHVARQAIVFNRAYSTASWTAPAMASIFTGLYPREHGVLHGVAQGPKAAITGQEMLENSFITLPEILKNAGYTTFGISSNGHLSQSTGFGQGFDYFATHWFMKSPAPNVSIKKWQNTIRNAHPYFLWIHYFDPHNPYAPRSPWFEKYMPPDHPNSQWSREVMANPKEYIDAIKSDPTAFNTLIDRYDSEINFCDYHIGQIFQLLQPDENTLVIITSDHGEAFLEHDQLLHGDTLYEEEIRVPLIIRLPGSSPTPRVLENPVTIRDIYATIVDLTGIDADDGVPGSSLSYLWLNQNPQETEPIYFELDWNGYWKGVRQGQWKFLTGGPTASATQSYLFNLDTDPQEKTSQLETNPGKSLLMKNLLDNWLKLHPVYPAEKINLPIDPDKENKLKSLGYL